jgi:hypothetical protein
MERLAALLLLTSSLAMGQTTADCQKERAAILVQDGKINEAAHVHTLGLYSVFYSPRYQSCMAASVNLNASNGQGRGLIEKLDEHRIVWWGSWYNTADYSDLMGNLNRKIDVLEEFH